MSRSGEPALAVALHDVEPGTFERCALLRDWLTDLGVERVTLLVIPARDLHPLADRSPEITRWLIDRQRAGDALAQHGFQHARSPMRALAPRLLREPPEFIGLDAHETARALDAGRRVLKLAGIETGGFVAPAYAYTPELRELLCTRFRWWAGLWGVHASSDSGGTSGQGPARLAAPAIGLGSASAARRAVSPSLLRLATVLAGDVLRLDLHPEDLEHPGHILTLEWALRRALPRRRSVTYDELAAAA
jgi:predicted deacetylase